MEQRDRNQSDLSARACVGRLGPGPRRSGGLLRAATRAAASLLPQYFLPNPEYRCRATGKQLEFKPVSDQLKHLGHSLRRARARFQGPGRVVRLLGQKVVDQQFGGIRQLVECPSAALADEGIRVVPGRDENAAPEQPRLKKDSERSQ